MSQACPGSVQGAPCCQGRWQREPAALRALTLSDPVIPPLGTGPRSVIKGSRETRAGDGHRPVVVRSSATRRAPTVMEWSKEART